MKKKSKKCARLYQKMKPDLYQIKENRRKEKPGLDCHIDCNQINLNSFDCLSVCLLFRLSMLWMSYKRAEASLFFFLYHKNRTKRKWKFLTIITVYLNLQASTKAKRKHSEGKEQQQQRQQHDWVDVVYSRNVKCTG